MTQRLQRAEEGIKKKEQTPLNGIPEPDGICHICGINLASNSVCLLDKFLCSPCMRSNLKTIVRESCKQRDLFERYKSCSISKTCDTHAAVTEQ